MDNHAAHSLRQLAYGLQRTGNPRCEDEAMEIHERLDNMSEFTQIAESVGLATERTMIRGPLDIERLRERADTLQADENGNVILDRNNPDHREWLED